MEKQGVDSKDCIRRGVSLQVLLFSIVATAVIVSGAFVLQHRTTANLPAQTNLTGAQVTSTASKPTAAFSATPNASQGTAASIPTPVPVALTNEELFRLKSPSVVMLQVFDQSGVMTKTGSGFVAGPDGTVITNYHMIRGAFSEKAVFQDGTIAAVLGVLGYSSTEDLAAIRLSATPAGPLELGDSDSVEVGNRVVAIGSPHGLQNTISDGLVSAMRDGRIQTSAPISPGSSGGPFFNQHGQVIGVAVSGIRNAQNLNFVVPINLAKSYLAETTLTTLPDMVARNTVVRPILNSTVTIEAGQNYELPIVIDENGMDNAEVGGKFQSSGGVGGRVRVFVQNRETNELLYDSQRVTGGQFDLRLRPGVYRLVISNTESVLFPRAVTALFGLRFVR